MSSTIDLLKSIQTSGSGLTLAELLTRHPDIARRTAQRQIAKLIESGQVNAQGEGRARRYFGAVTQIGVAMSAPGSDNNFPFFIPLSADSQDILAYVSQALEARKPVGYQHEFLQTYHLNVSWFDELLALRKIEFADLWYFAWSQKNRACARFLKQESGSDPG